MAISKIWIGFIAFMPALAVAEPTSIEVFTDSRIFQISGMSAQTTIYDFAMASNLENSLSRNLSHDPAMAAQMARLRIADPKNAKAIRDAFMGYSKAIAYGVKKIPAFVFDGKAVVYGSTNIMDGIMYYRRWRGR